MVKEFIYVSVIDDRWLYVLNSVGGRTNNKREPLLSKHVEATWSLGITRLVYEIHPGVLYKMRFLRLVNLILSFKYLPTTDPIVMITQEIF